MKITHIGNVWHDSPGFDAYYLLKLDEEDERRVDVTNETEVQAYVSNLFAEHSHKHGGPGQMFCNTSRVLPGHADLTRIGVAYVRWDV